MFALGAEFLTKIGDSTTYRWPRGNLQQFDRKITGSLDACILLQRKFLPGCGCKITILPCGLVYGGYSLPNKRYANVEVAIMPIGGEDKDSIKAYSCSPALAMLSAILLTLADKMERKNA